MDIKVFAMGLMFSMGNYVAGTCLKAQSTVQKMMTIGKVLDFLPLTLISPYVYSIIKSDK